MPMVSLNNNCCFQPLKDTKYRQLLNPEGEVRLRRGCGIYTIVMLRPAFM